MARVIFWLGPTVAGKFDPRTAIGTGIGGSETAAIHLTRELAALGHEVLVFAEVVGQGAHQGVEWRFGGSDFPSDFPCDLFVSSRHPEALRAVRPRCRRKWLWVHDLHCGPDWDDAIGDYDRVLCLTKWAREKFLAYYPGLDATKVCQTSNAVDLSAFSGHLGKPGDQHLDYRLARALRVTYSSSPDRGLDNLLDLWDAVRSMVAPRLAELHVYYGFETWRRLAELHDSDVERSRVERLEARLAGTAGVYHHGRAGQHEVARSYMHSQLWLYPTDFLETSCITAMEAQAAHCKVVATRCGALPETVPGAWFVDGPTTRPGYREAFLASVRAALCDDSVFVQTPRTWADVAREWDRWLRVELL